MTDATFLIPACRPDMLHALLDSWSERPWARRFDAVVVLMGFSEQEVAAVRRRMTSPLTPTYARALYVEERRPPFFVRTDTYRRHEEVETWILLDDDMEFIDETNYAAAIRKAQAPDVGIVACNWVRTESPKLRARARYEYTFLKQPIVYTGGGMVFHRKVVEAIFALPIKAYTFDDAQTALCAYLAGYENFRFLGSLAIHRTCHKGGLQQTYRERPFFPPDPAYLTVAPSKANPYPFPGQNHLMPSSSNLTDRAHREHHERRSRLLA